MERIDPKHAHAPCLADAIGFPPGFTYLTDGPRILVTRIARLILFTSGKKNGSCAPVGRHWGCTPATRGAPEPSICPAEHRHLPDLEVCARCSLPSAGGTREGERLEIFLHNALPYRYSLLTRYVVLSCRQTAAIKDAGQDCDLRPGTQKSSDARAPAEPLKPTPAILARK